MSLIGSWLLVTLLIPKISWIVKSRDLMNHPNHRDSHKASIPTMAGISFFLTFLFILSLIKAWDHDEIGINLIAAIGLMFAVGLKDDLTISTPRAKIGSEILAILFVLFCNCLKLSSLEGFLGIGSIPNIVSYPIVILIILTIINSFNLIDGIDGLASIIGIMIFALFGIIFYLAGESFYFLLCLCLIGILLAYLPFNLSASKKIFMGDTGSLIIGFCIGFLSIKFLTMESFTIAEYSFQPQNKLVVIAAIFFMPLFDTLRVMGVRLLNKKSPFTPDKSHIHHILINSGLTHFKASFFLCFLNFLIAVALIYLSFSLNSFQMIIMMAVLFVALLGLFHKLNMNVEQKNNFKYLIRTIQFLF